VARLSASVIEMQPRGGSAKVFRSNNSSIAIKRNTLGRQIGSWILAAAVIVVLVVFLCWAKSAEAQFSIETIEPHFHWDTSTVVLPDGRIAVGYVHSDPFNNIGSIRYAIRDDFGWQIEEVVGGAPWSIAMDIAQDGMPHISYLRSNGFVARYVYRDADGWHSETIENTNGWVGDSAIAIGPADSVSVSYVSGGWLRYTLRTGGGWEREWVDQGNVGSYSDMIVDFNGIPHITYVDDTLQALRIASRYDEDWHISTIDDIGAVAGRNRLTIDAQGKLWVLYKRDGVHQIACQDGAGWTIEAIDSAPSGYKWDLAVDDAQVPHIGLYRASGEFDVYYITKEADNWLVNVVEEAGQVGGGISIAVDSDRIPHVTYHENLGFRNGRCASFIPPLPISGSITESGEPLTGAQVELLHEGEVLLLQVTDDGDYEFTDVPMGDYQVRASSPEHVELVRVGVTPGDQSVDFDLVRKTTQYDNAPTTIFVTGIDRIQSLYAGRDDNGDGLEDIGQML